MLLKDISVVIPVYNEEDNLQELYDRLLEVMRQLGITFEMLFINDGSGDRSPEIILKLAKKDADVRYISLSRNFGHQIAVSAGIDHAAGKNIVIMDSDLQDPPEAIIAMYGKLQEGFDVVSARRRKRRGESFMKKFTAKVYYRLLRRITSVDIPVDTGDFRIMKRKVAEVLKRMPEQNKFIRGQIAWAGFRQGFIEYDRDERKSGRTGYSYGRMSRFAKDGITSFSDLPMKAVTYSGFVFAFVAFVVGLYSLYSKLIWGSAVPGWASLMISVLFLGGVQLISIGIIGEYISRIASNVKNRPLYVISESNIGQADAEENSVPGEL